MKNIKNAKSETSHSIVGGCMLLCEVSDFVRSMFFKVYNFELI